MARRTVFLDTSFVVALENRDDPYHERAKALDREMLREVLERSGFKCVAAENGTVALGLLEEIHPDAAILDVVSVE